MARGKARRPDPAPITFDEFWQISRALWANLERKDKALSAIPGVGSGPMGLTPDSVKFSPEFQTARAEYRKAESALKEFNRAFAKRFAKQSAARIRADREAKAAARLAGNREGESQCL